MFLNCSVFTVNVLSVSHRIIVADKDQVLVLTASDCAFVQWVNNAHIRLLLEAQQAILKELHTVAPIGTDTDHCPYYQCDLRDSTVVDSQFMQPHSDHSVSTLYYCFQESVPKRIH